MTDLFILGFSKNIEGVYVVYGLFSPILIPGDGTAKVFPAPIVIFKWFTSFEFTSPLFCVAIA